MKKLISALLGFFLLSAVLCAQERVLFDASKLSEATFSAGDVTIDNGADNWFVDFGNLGVKGVAQKGSLIKGAGDRGVGIVVEIDSAYFNDKYVAATLRPNVLAQLTENESGNGKITNVADIKSIKVEGFSLGYEVDVILDMERSDGSVVGVSPMKTQQLGSSPFEATWVNPNYIDDPAKRDIKVKPVYPNTSSELILNGITIRGKPFQPNKVSKKSYLILYINKVTVVADKAYESEDTTNEELWGLEASANATYGEKQKKQIETREILKNKEKALMATEAQDAK